nr:ABC transporter permease subunit [Clostridia bacterium]
DYGILNKLTGLWGMEPVAFMGVRQWFRSIYVLSGVWQNTGWSSIVYLSALSGIDPQLHESAMMDGATRLQRIWHINLPAILPTVAMLFVLQSGGLMSVGFEKVFLMQNAVNLEVSEVISTYVYKVGLLQTQFSFSAAVGLFNSAVNCALLLATNLLSKRLAGSGLF